MTDPTVVELTLRLRELEVELAEIRRQLNPPKHTQEAATPTSETDESASITRRSLFTKAGIVAAGVGGASLVAGIDAGPAAADTGTMQYGADNHAGDGYTNLTSTAANWTLNLDNEGEGNCLRASNAGHDHAVYAQVFSNELDTLAVNAAVYGESVTLKSAGIEGACLNVHNNSAGVWGETAGIGSAVYGRNTNTASTAAVFGDASGSTAAVWGRSRGTVKSGVGVRGESDAGRGGTFRGDVAAVRMEPSTAGTHPTKGQRGDFVVDSTGRLWFCNGTTNWTQLA